MIYSIYKKTIGFMNAFFVESIGNVNDLDK